MNPHIYRTHDGGKTWTEIVNGIPGGAPVSVVREDPKTKGLLFAGIGNAGLRLVRRRRPLAVAAAEHGAVVGARPHHQRRRPRRRHARPRDLDSRRHHAAAADRQRRPQAQDVRAVQAAERVARAVEHEHRHAAAARRADGAESARGRDHQLLPEVRGVGTGDARDRSARTAGWCAATRAPTRSFTPDPATNDRAALLVPPAAGAVGRRPGMHRFTWDVHYQPLDSGRRRRVGGATCRSRRSATTPCRRRRRRGRIPGSTP